MLLTNTKAMTNYVVIIIISLLIILFFPMVAKVKVIYNFIDNKGKFSVVFLNKIRIISFKFKFVKSILKITKKNGKIEFLDLKSDNRSLEFYNNLNKALFKRLNVKSSYLFINVGAHNNAFLTSMLAGYIQAVCAGILSYLKVSKNTTIINNVYPKYDREVLNITFKARFSFSIIGVTSSCLEAYFKNYKKTKKVGKKYGTQQ